MNDDGFQWFMFFLAALVIGGGILYYGHAKSECDGELLRKANGLYYCLEDK